MGNKGNKFSSFEKGDEIILNDLEIPTTNLPWIGKGFNLKYVKSRDYKIYIEDIKKQIINKTKAILISWVNTFTGYKIDLHELSKICKERGIKLIVNASQGIGAYELNLDEIEIDFCVFIGYKRLLAGYGIACLYINKNNFGKQKYEIFNGWMSAKEPHDVVNDHLETKKDARKFDIGSPHFAGIFALGEAINYLNNIGFDKIEKKINELSFYLIKKLKENSIEITFPITFENEISGIIYIKPKNFEDLKKYLIKNEVYVASYENGIRISFHFYNSFEEIDRLIDYITSFYQYEQYNEKNKI